MICLTCSCGEPTAVIASLRCGWGRRKAEYRQKRQQDEDDDEAFVARVIGKTEFMSVVTVTFAARAKGDASLFPLYHSFICWAAGSLVCL